MCGAGRTCGKRFSSRTAFSKPHDRFRWTIYRKKYHFVGEISLPEAFNWPEKEVSSRQTSAGTCFGSSTTPMPVIYTSQGRLVCRSLPHYGGPKARCGWVAGSWRVCRESQYDVFSIPLQSPSSQAARESPLPSSTRLSKQKDLCT
jgi:hypothetical protein